MLICALYSFGFQLMIYCLMKINQNITIFTVIEKGSPGFDTRNPQDHRGYSHFTSGGPGHSGFNFRPNEWQNMGGQGKPKAFSFSVGNPGGKSSFGFGSDDIFSNLFRGETKSGGPFGGFDSSTKSQSASRSSPKSIHVVNSQVYGKEINDKVITWLLLS